jgi:hypothetical protein
MCGRLLHSASPLSPGNKRDIGEAGPACQIRGEIVQWDALPLFLLLWSKRMHASRLKTVFNYDALSNKLSLVHGVASAPWLHFVQKRAGKDLTDVPTRKNGAQMLDPVKPWWYCRQCHAYWLPMKSTGECASTQRVPMRNW